MSHTLVVFLPNPSLVDLTVLSALVQSDRIQWPQPTVARFLGASTNHKNEVAQWAAKNTVDIAWVDEKLRFEDFGLIVSDMDSTFITIECIDEMAGCLGIQEPIARITQKAMAGEMNFADALKARVQLLAGIPENDLEPIYQNHVKPTSGALDLVKMAHEAGLYFMLLSGGFTYFAKRLQEDYGLDFAYANTLEVFNGKLTGHLTGSMIDERAKADLLVKVSGQLKLKPSKVIAVGDGANDIFMLKKAGVGVAFHAKPLVEKAADYVIRYNGLDAIRWLFE